MFKELIEKLKAHPRTIVFTEGTDPRILEASAAACRRETTARRAEL